MALYYQVLSTSRSQSAGHVGERISMQGYNVFLKMATGPKAGSKVMVRLSNCISLDVASYNRLVASILRDDPNRPDVMPNKTHFVLQTVGTDGLVKSDLMTLEEAKAFAIKAKIQKPYSEVVVCNKLLTAQTPKTVVEFK